MSRATPTLCRLLPATLIAAALLGCQPGSQSEPIPDALFGIWCQASDKGADLIVITRDEAIEDLPAGPALQRLWKSKGHAAGRSSYGPLRQVHVDSPGHDDETWLVIEVPEGQEVFGQVTQPQQILVRSLSATELVLGEPAVAETSTYRKIAAIPAIEVPGCVAAAPTPGGADAGVGPPRTPTAALNLAWATSLAGTDAYAADAVSAGSSIFAAAWVDLNDALSVALFFKPIAPAWTATAGASDVSAGATRLALDASANHLTVAFPHRGGAKTGSLSLDDWGAKSRSVAVARYSSKGAPQWLQFVGGPGGDDDVAGLSALSFGGVALTATTRGDPLYVAPAQGKDPQLHGSTLFAALDAAGGPSVSLASGVAQPSDGARVLDSAVDTANNLRVLVSGAGGTSLSALRLNDFSAIWTRDLTTETTSEGRVAMHSSSEAVAAWEDGRLRLARFASADGALRWQVALDGTHRLAALGVLTNGVAVVASATIAADNSATGWLRAFAASGDAVWELNYGATDLLAVRRILPWQGEHFLLFGRLQSPGLAGIAVPAGVYVAAVSAKVLP